MSKLEVTLDEILKTLGDKYDLENINISQSKEMDSSEMSPQYMDVSLRLILKK